MKACPICKGDWSKVEDSESVCKVHQGYFVITCCVCGKVKFSSTAHICGRCLDTQPAAISRNGFSINHRVPLIISGLEGWR